MRDTGTTPEGTACASHTDVALLHTAFAALRTASKLDRTPQYAIRMDRLRRLLALTSQNQDRILAAISADFGHRSAHEMQLAEIFTTLSAIRHNMRHLRGWMKARRVATPLHMRPGRSRLLRQPLGVVGIIAPWNYPFHLAMAPAAAALAAGNAVLIKPSELTPRLSQLMKELVEQTFAPHEMAVATGGAEVGAAFSALPFDHLFFTGSTQVGRAVAQAAAANLTPVTLELGGKSPAIVAADCDLDVAAPRLAFGKLFNAGQTCVAPDYALVPRQRIQAFVQAMQRATRAMYPGVMDNADYTAIVSQRHRERLARLLDNARQQGAVVVPLAAPENTAGPHLKQAPVLVLNVNDSMQIMREEIFGPLLPVVPYDTLDDALEYVNRGDHPLALYWFGKSVAERERVLKESIAGGVTINDALWHVAQENLPFGGVGASGMGSYHGEHGFRTFSKEKPVFVQARWNAFGIFRPPYGRLFERAIGALKALF
ncbi:coniferyl aldehyde dehydrogenase [Pseudoduganella ginsengisoli]|uniref:Aldehyde dehydrogenase n=1 Tax=Pseudoduganella ginsengisoli TaxID=1462440 RepID=A0A6L6Q5I5_9BURK|nr:aldehyde dehydrogenase family protein [Pseudoduganella ginsengisoli]